MYYSRWGLSENPFRGTPATEHFYPSAMHEEALARLHYLIEQRHQVGLLVGESGSGKSLLLSVFAGECSKTKTVVLQLNLTALSAPEVPQLLADQLLIRSRDRRDATYLWRSITDRLVEHRYEQRATVVLLDNASSGSEEVFDQILRLLYFDPTGATPLTIVVACERHLLTKVPLALCEAANLRIELPPWELADTQGFLSATMSSAGVEETVFDGAAVQRIHLLAQGNPRRVSQLADLALLAGAADDAARIDEQIVDAVAEELVEIGDR